MRRDMYTIVFSDDAKKDLKELQKKAPQALSKLAKLLDELKEHPRTATGHPSGEGRSTVEAGGEPPHQEGDQIEHRLVENNTAMTTFYILGFWISRIISDMK